MERTWDFPKKSFVKINTHAIHFPQPLPNGNTSGLGMVMRDHKGVVVLMVSGTIQGITERANELWAMLIGLRCAFYEQEYNLQIESDNEEAIREWKDWRWFVDPNHSGVIQQLLQREKDPNLKLEPAQVITPNQNRLARFLAEDGAQNRSRLVVFRRPFGQARDLWRLDMGLGPLDARFLVMEEEDYMNQMAEEEEEEGYGDLLAQDADSANMGAVIANV